MSLAQRPSHTLRRLIDIVGEDHARQRLALEQRHHQQVITWHRKFLHLENWYSIHSAIRLGLRVLGLHGRGQRNARQIRHLHHEIVSPRIPRAFNGYRILHLSDLHLDMDLATTHAIAQAVRQVDYDLCVMTGDYRANTFGDSDRAMALMADLRHHLPDPVVAILGNHDSIHMVPVMQDMGIEVLVNRAKTLERGGEVIGLAGVDDGHYFKLDDIAGSKAQLDPALFSILLCHTPERFQVAAQAGFDVYLCGHTHGGQICLPGGIPVTLEARCPRSLGRGHWQFGQMQGYTSVGASTSVVNVRLNCPPEITTHILRSTP